MALFLVLPLLMATTSVVALPAMAAQAQVNLHEHVVAKRKLVTVADVASVQAATPGLRQLIESTTLFSLGSGGQPLRLQRERIARMLHTRLPALRGHLQLMGAHSVLLDPPAGPAVHAGSEVKVRSLLGAIAVEGRATSLEDGYPGARVRLRNPRSRQTFLATVLGPDLVEAQ